MKNYRYRSFARLPHDKIKYYRNQLHGLKGQPTIKILSFTLRSIPISDLPKIKLTFGEMTTLQKRGQKGDIFEALQIVFRWRGFKVPIWFLFWVRVTTFYEAWNHIRKELEALAKKEKLNWEPKASDSDYSRAGSKNLARFGNYQAVAAFGKNYGKTPAEVYELPYMEVFTEGAFSTVQGDVMKKYQEIKSKPNKPR